MPRWAAWLLAAVAGAAAVTAVLMVPRLVGSDLAAGPGALSPSATATASPELGESPSPSASAPTIPEPGPVVFTLAAAGDVLPHLPVDRSAEVPGGYDFVPLMAGVEPYIEGADLAICHMEVPVVGDGQSLSGYPIFGAPKEIVRDLKKVGWDGCSTASNHSVDRKMTGVDATLDALEVNRMGYAGTARTEDEAASTQFYLVRSGSRIIKVAHISFAYGLNGLPKPADAPWSVNTFDADAADASPIIAAAQRARDQGADVVVASVHCCVEYRTEPTAAQRSVAEQIASSGLVDLYIGHHAHVPQPIELLPGGTSGKGMWTAFGLGNFLSNQDGNCCVSSTDSGVLLTATFTVDVDGAVDVGVEWTAITVDRLDHHTMHALREIPDGAGRLSASEVAARLSRVQNAVGPSAPERTAPASHHADAAFSIPRKPWQPGD